jgi:tetratricopeptide (TPR) repeat protein
MARDAPSAHSSTPYLFVYEVTGAIASNKVWRVRMESGLIPSPSGSRRSATTRRRGLIVERNRIAEFKEVAELMPDDPVVRFGLAGAYLEAGQPEEAVLEYQETIRLKPDYSAAHRGLGRALEQAGRLAEAEAAYAAGLEVATRTGDLQTKKEIEVFLRRLGKRGD